MDFNSEFWMQQSMIGWSLWQGITSWRSLGKNKIAHILAKKKVEDTGISPPTLSVVP